MEEATSARATADIWKSARRFSNGSLCTQSFTCHSSPSTKHLFKSDLPPAQGAGGMTKTVYGTAAMMRLMIMSTWQMCWVLSACGQPLQNFSFNGFTPLFSYLTALTGGHFVSDAKPQIGWKILFTAKTSGNTLKWDQGQPPFREICPWSSYSLSEYFLYFNSLHLIKFQVRFALSRIVFSCVLHGILAQRRSPWPVGP